MDVTKWLETLKLEEYSGAFRENDIDAEVLPDLTSDDLRDIGVAKIGHRRKLLKAISDLNEEPPSSRPEASPDNKTPPPPPAQAVEDTAERRQLTVMFVDLAGAADLTATCDPEDLQPILTRYQDTVAGVISRYGGYVAQYLSDGVMAYFGWPQAHEDEAERAVQAALGIVARVGRIDLPDGTKARTHIGIATGPVVVSELTSGSGATESAAHGPTPNLAARLQAQTEPDQVIIAPSTRALVGGLFEIKNLGPATLKGIDTPVDLCAVEGESNRSSRFAALRADQSGPIVGRMHECAEIADLWAKVQGGQGQMTVITGEAGIGKSRITQAALDDLAPQVHLVLQCSPYHVDSPFYPLIQNLQSDCGIVGSDTPDQRIAKLRDLADLPPDDVLLVASVLGVDVSGLDDRPNLPPAALRTQAMKALSRYYLAKAVSAPCLILFEDLHWADPTTLEFLEFLLDEIETRSVLILGTARPAFTHHLSARPNVHQVLLNRLRSADIEDIVSGVTGGKTMPDEVLRLIADRTDGVPLFVEEMTRTLIEGDMLQERDDRYVLSGDLTDTAVPVSLNDSFMARLDRNRDAKAVALMAACIGREFDHGLLHLVSQLPPDQMASGLAQLQSSQLVHRRGQPPECTYIFKHALLRDAAYENLMRPQRQDIHARILSALEEQGDASADLLAQHAEASGQTERAIDLWEAASKAAFAQPAYAEATAHLSRAMALLQPAMEAGDQTAVSRAVVLQVQKGTAILAGRGHAAPETRAAFRMALDLAERAGDTDNRFGILFGLSTSNFVHGSLDLSIRYGHQYLAFAESQNEDAARASAHRTLGNALFALADLEQAQFHFESSKALFDPERHKGLSAKFGGDLGVTTHGYIALNLMSMGRSQAGLAELETCAHYAALVPDDVFSQCYLMTMRFLFHAMDGDHLSLAQYCEPLLELSGEHGMALFHAAGAIGASQARLGLGERDAIPAFEAAVQEVEDTASLIYLPFNLTEGGLRVLKMGEVGLAEKYLDLAREKQARTETRNFVSDTLRLSGLLARERGGVDQAEDDLQSARALAHQQGGLLSALRAEIELSRLWVKRGQASLVAETLPQTLSRIAPGDCAAEVAAAQDILDQVRS